MLVTFLIIFATIVLFIWNRLRPDLVALVSLLALFVTGVLSSQQALAGFSDSTTVMVAALFVVGEGLTRTGVSAWLGQRLVRSAGSSELRLLIAILIGTALISAFLSNTGTVAVGASAALLTPIASPVNTLVFAPGGYRFGDYAKVGLPLLLLMLLVSVLLAPMIWPLY